MSKAIFGITLVLTVNYSPNLYDCWTFIDDPQSPLAILATPLSSPPGILDHQFHVNISLSIQTQYH